MSNRVFDRRYREKHRAAGLCLKCSRKAYLSGVYCRQHRDQRRRWERRRAGCKPWRPGGRGRPPLEFSA